jgi:RHS repeat-associated protein
VCVLDGKTHMAFQDFFADSPNNRAGIQVAAGDLDNDGKADIATATEGGSQVRIFRGKDNASVGQFPAFTTTSTGGVRLALGDFDGNGSGDIAVGNGPGGGLVRLLDGVTRQQQDSLTPFGKNFDGGLFVAATRPGGFNPNDPTPVVTVSATKAFTREGSSDTGQFTFSRTGDTSSGLTINVSVGGSASFSALIPQDYTLTGSDGSTVNFASGSSTATVTLTAQTDSNLEGSETAVLTVTPGTGYDVGSPSLAVVLIGDVGNVLPTPVGGTCDVVPNASGAATGGTANYSGSGVRYSDGAGGMLYPDAAGGGSRGGGGDVWFPYSHGSGGNDLSPYGSGSGGDDLFPLGSGSGFDYFPLGGGFDYFPLGSGSGSCGCQGAPARVSVAVQNAEGYATSTLAGNSTVLPEIMHLNQDGGGIVTVVTGPSAAIVFDPSGLGGSYTARYGQQETLSSTFGIGGTEFTFTDTLGNVSKFYGFDSSIAAAQRGQLKSLTDAAGNSTSVTAYTSDGRPSELQASVTVGGTTTINSKLLTYITSGTNAGKVSNIALRRQVGGGSWSTVRQTDLTYYDGSGSGGTAGDLQKVTIKDGSGTTLDTLYFRYYTSSSSTGFAGALKYAFGAASYGRLAAAFSDPTTATDAQVAPYADVYYEYDSMRRVTSAVVQGAGCSVCTGGLGTFSYTYDASPFADGYGNWHIKTTETLPDGNQNIVYTNFAGEVVLHVHKDVTSGNTWETFFKYDSNGKLIQAAAPSAITGYDDTKADLLNNQAGNYQYLSDSAGLIGNITYGTSTTATSSTAGDVAGYYKSTSIQRGETGTAIPQRTEQYFSRTGGSITVYALATETAYRNTDGTGSETTSYSYTWVSGTVKADSFTVTLPTISSGQNGPGTADTTTTYFDAFGRPTWSKDGDGFLTYREYDAATGAVTKFIQDVDTTQTGDFSGLPSGWSTPSGGGLHLKTLYEVDSQGRTTKVTDPNGNITYTVYNDANHEVRMYPGWDSTNNVPTGPTQVYRVDRAGSYAETLTMSATPHLTSGRPDGTESIGSLQTLSRRYANSAGQLDHSDAYFSLTGLTYSTSTSLGTENTNFYRTAYVWDEHRQLKRTQTPTGTIYRTVFDALGRPVSEWVGTDDTPTSGFWSPTNTAGTDLVKVRDYEYDSGGVGDNTLTKVTDHPGGSAADRVKQSFFDWRDRLVAVKSGVETSESTSVNRPIVYYTLDNLGETPRTQMYDGDGVSITVTNGVPDAPSSSLLRAQSDTSFDDQGRAYQSKVFSVDPSSGSVSTNALTTNTWLDHRGQVIKSSAPGGLVMKYQYDGAGRTTKTFTTDGGGDSGWSDASNVTGDAVLEQVEPTYDSDGNVILTTTRQRFHDDAATGALGDPNTSPKARVSYTASYYDKANRPSATAQVGTNGGSAYTRPSSVPSRSDTVLVVESAYNSAGWVETTTDPRGLVGKTFYDNLGRTTKTVENYVDGTPSNSDDKTTEYTYDGSGHVLTLKASLASGYEQTQWVYGTASGTSDDITSNDLQKETRYPDQSSGNASSTDKIASAVNALGQTKGYTDRSGNIHALTFDVLGRVVSDAVSTLGSGVDGTVRRIEIGYDPLGNVSFQTSFDANSGGNIVNQAQREFNGLGQLVTEYQSHSGAVNTSTTPKVQYAYSEMSGGANHSRPANMTYPNGKVLTFNYGSGLNDTISRLSSLSDTTGSLESYDYLGLATIVRRAHSQPGVDLTYIKQSGESDGDAGDQYTGLDRFGRVVDQRWIKTSTGTATDRFKYGYDRDGNVLWRDNLVNSAFGEVYQYDGLNQITSFKRGTLNTGKTDVTGSPSRSQSWGYDALGNWSAVTTDGAEQSRSANKQNQYTAVDSATPVYDANGNMTTDETGKQFVYDAWNRLVTVKDYGGTTLVSYVYDAANHRIQEVTAGTTKDLYYSGEWQILEERVNGSATTQYVWSSLYLDALLLRDRDTDANGTLEERLWAQQDVSWNITALLSSSGAVQERFVLDSFGTPTFLDAAWATHSSSGASWLYFYQGARFATTAGLYSFRLRDYSPTLGRWLQPDPLSFGSGDDDLYRAVANNPLSVTDPFGLQQTKPKPPPLPDPDPPPSTDKPRPPRSAIDLSYIIPVAGPNSIFRRYLPNSLWLFPCFDARIELHSFKFDANPFRIVHVWGAPLQNPAQEAAALIAKYNFALGFVGIKLEWNQRCAPLGECLIAVKLSGKGKTTIPVAITYPSIVDIIGGKTSLIPRYLFFVNLTFDYDWSFQGGMCIPCQKKTIVV